MTRPRHVETSVVKKSAPGLLVPGSYSATGVFAPPSMTSSIGNLAREIEARGVSTLILSASPAATESVTKVIR